MHRIRVVTRDCDVDQEVGSDPDSEDPYAKQLCSLFVIWPIDVLNHNNGI